MCCYDSGLELFGKLAHAPNHCAIPPAAFWVMWGSCRSGFLLSEPWEGNLRWQSCPGRPKPQWVFPLTWCRHTLWKRVQDVVTPFLAIVISHIDRDGNLELLARPDLPPWTQDLWMFIYGDIKFLNIPLVSNYTR